MTVLASVLVLTSTTVGHADQPNGTLAGSIPTGATGLTGTSDAAPAGTHVVTLPTGDTVTVAPSASGRSDYSVRPAARPDRPVVSFRATTVSGDLHVVPSDAEPYLVSGAVDPRLFDVTELVRQGVADSASTLPLIVTYRSGPSPAAITSTTDALAASTRTRTLSVVHGAAIRVNRASAATFWDSIDTAGPAARGRLDFGRGIARVSLDLKVHATLDQSVPQIGAPTAWQAGIDGTGVKVAVLDTGIDATHPDFAGRIGAEANFTDSPTTTDLLGHGTHVASIVAGSGAASGGRFRGVAPGATLLIGKVLGDNGVGDASATIAGMQWAVSNGARVINLSLSSDSPSDDSDPLSQAVDQISDQSGVLVVAAAGNGTLLHTVNAPASAEQALAVGAVDKSDRLAGFSSRGPGLTSGSVKPEITAPGVNIVAARAARTNLGPIVDTDYTRLSGTSMAAPHVAGAAVLMAEQNPTWTGPDLRRALVSTAKDGGFRWFEQGAGRVDVTRAFTQRVYGSAAINFGSFAFPQSGTATRPATFSNDTDTAVTLHLAPQVADFSGTPAPVGALRLGVDTVTVPAHGRAEVDLTVDPTLGPDSVYGGVLTASTSDGSVQLRTPLSWRKAPETQDVTVRVLNSHGQPENFGLVEIVRVDFPQPDDPFADKLINLPITNGIGHITLARGTYSMHTLVEDLDLHTRRETLAAAPEVTIPGPVSGPPPGNFPVTLDASKGVPVRPKTPRPTRNAGIWLGMSRTSAAGQVIIQQDISLLLPDVEVYVTPTRPVTTGSFAEYDRWTLEPPLLSARTTGHTRITLHPTYDPVLAAPKFAGRRTLPVVFAGPGRAEDFAGTDVTGKLALVALPAPPDTEQGMFDGQAAAAQVTAAAARAGAAGVLVYL
ncbi:MAG TPA: S8 family serine peptidase, partial [Mycobacteriales bacterium]|nr:S8 family serine peptidase [Mycobacteriales bacterium]